MNMYILSTETQTARRSYSDAREKMIYKYDRQYKLSFELE